MSFEDTWRCTERVASLSVIFDLCCFKWEITPNCIGSGSSQQILVELRCAWPFLRIVGMMRALTEARHPSAPFACFSLLVAYGKVSLGEKRGSRACAE